MQYQDLNKLEDSIREKERRRSIKGKDHKHNLKKTSPTQVEDKFNNITDLSEDYVKKLANVKYKYPVISLYFNIAQKKKVDSPQKFQTYFNSLRSAIQKKHADYLKRLDAKEEQTMKKDLEEVTQLLQKHLANDHLNSIIIFKSNEELHSVIKLPLTIEDHLSVDLTPYVSPLEALLQEQRRILIVKLDKHRSAVYLYQLGTMKQLQNIDLGQPEVLTDRIDRDSMKIHKQEHLYRHYTKLNQYVYDNIANQSFDYLLVVGHEKTTTKKFIDSMHIEAQSRLLDSKNLSPQDIEDKAKLDTVIQQALQQYEEDVEELAFEELKKAKGQGGLIDGLEQVIKAQNRGLITTLYVNPHLQQAGFICPDKHYMSLDRDTCRLCDKKLIAVPSCVDDLIELAAKQNIDIVLFSRKPELMSEFQNIAALLYM